jgi:hypothetical protein
MAEFHFPIDVCTVISRHYGKGVREVAAVPAVSTRIDHSSDTFFPCKLCMEKADAMFLAPSMEVSNERVELGAVDLGQGPEDEA